MTTRSALPPSNHSIGTVAPQAGWNGVIAGLIHVIEWLFLAMLVIFPADIYLTPPGKSRGIFVSQLLGAVACMLLGVVLLLGRLRKRPDGFLLHLKDIWPLVLLLFISLLAVVGAHSRSVGLRECGKYAFFLGVYALARALAQAEIIRARIHLYAITAVIIGYGLVLGAGVYMSVPGVPDIPGIVLNIQRVNAYVPGTDILRNAATFRYPDELSAYLLLILPLLAACALKFPDRLERIFFGLLLISGVWLFVQTSSRTGLLICLLMGPVLFYVLGKRGWAMVTIGFGILAAVAVVCRGGQTATRILSLLSFSDTGYTSRLAVWQWAWHAFVQHPLLGVGPRNLQFVPGAPYADLYRHRIETNAESTYLNVLVDMGILGAAVVATIVVGAVRRVRVALRTPTTWLGEAWHAGVGVGLLALLIDGTVHPTLYSSQVVGVLCALIGLMPLPSVTKPATTPQFWRKTDDSSSVLASRVALLLNGRESSRVKHHSLHLAAELQQKGVDVLVVAPPNDPAHALAKHKGLPTRELGLELLHGHLGTLAALNPLSRRHTSESLHALAQGGPMIFVCPYLREQLLVAPETMSPDSRVVWVLHSTPVTWPQRMLLRRQWVTQAGKANAVAIVSRRIADETAKLGIPAGRVEILPGLGQELLPGDEPAVERVSDWIVAVAPLTEAQGIQYLIGALPRVIQRHPRVRLTIAGSGSFRPELQRQVHNLGLEHWVEFLDAPPEHRRLLGQASLFVYPSVDPAEVLPAIIPEALAVGTPVVASSIGSIPDIVVDQKTGLLTWPGDAASIANAIISLLDDPDRAQAMGHAGREMMRYSHTSESTVDSFLQLLVDVETESTLRRSGYRP